MILRKSTMEDLTEINTLYGELTEYHIRELGIKGLDGVEETFTVGEYKALLKSPLKHDYVLDDNGTIVGYMSCRLSYNKVIVSRLIIKSDYRGLRLGDMFLDRIPIVFKNSKVIELNVFKKNKGAIKFYKRNGFKIKVDSNKRMVMYKNINKDVV